jgi:hypothetical protein
VKDQVSGNKAPAAQIPNAKVPNAKKPETAPMPKSEWRVAPARSVNLRFEMSQRPLTADEHAFGFKTSIHPNPFYTKGAKGAKRLEHFK